MFRVELLELLHRGLVGMGQSLDRQTESQLIRYIELISQWNKVFRLSSIYDLDAMVTRHLLDSLAVLPYVKGRTIVDVGTGAGLPGIPLAITMPDRHFCLIDTNRKKIQFLEKVCQQLSLRNVHIVNRAVEEFHVEPLFETVISRSFNTLNEFLTLSQHLVKPEGQTLAMKGVYPLTELQDLNPHFKLIEVHPLNIPALSAERHLVELTYQPVTTPSEIPSQIEVTA